jgi:high-affinity K+ transport system ATPase subunit B
MTQSTITVVKQGDRIPFDGKVIEGLAFVDESAQTGVSTPTLLEAVAGRDDVLADTLVLEGWLKIETQSSPTGRRFQNIPATKETLSRSPQQEPSFPVQSPKPKANALVKIGVGLMLALAVAMVFALIAYAATHSSNTAGVTGMAGFLLSGGRSITTTPFR